MSEGNEDAGESLLIYKNPKVGLISPNTYTKIMLDPVLIFRGLKKGRNLAGSSTADSRYVLRVDPSGTVQRLRDGR
jgi:hypothetical protein